MSCTVPGRHRRKPRLPQPAHRSAPHPLCWGVELSPRILDRLRGAATWAQGTGAPSHSSILLTRPLVTGRGARIFASKCDPCAHRSNRHPSGGWDRRPCRARRGRTALPHPAGLRCRSRVNAVAFLPVANGGCADAGHLHAVLLSMSSSFGCARIRGWVSVVMPSPPA